MRLRGKTVLVTGATGFIGGRLVEKLILTCQANVRALVRHFARASRVARFAVEMIPGSVTDASVLHRAVQGCDIVFHCAFGNTGTPEEQRAVNVDGTAVVMQSVLETGVPRLVHLSTISVYGRTADGDLDERTPPGPASDLYSATKLEAQHMLLDAHRRHSLPVIVLQPTVVYGPYGVAWTIFPLQEMRQRHVVLVNGGDGLCNAVYVDDVVDAMLLAAASDAPVGEVLLISGDAPRPWKAFYGAYEAMLGATRTLSMPADELRAQARRQAVVQDAWRDLQYRLEAQGVTSSMPPPTRLFHLPSEPIIDFFAARTHVRIEKAKRFLGYHPRFDLTAGMRLTEQWARWANLIPDASGVQS
jgi:nucleoside-diphosphate-sugar epimerase